MIPGLVLLAAAAVGLIIVAGSAYLYYRLEGKSLFVFAILICAAVIAGGSLSYIPLMSTPFILGGIGGFTFRKGKSLEFYLVAATVILAVLSAGFFYYYLLFLKVDFFGMQREVIARSLDAARVPADIREEWLEAFDQSKYLVPFGITANSLVLSSVSYIFINNALTRILNAGKVAGLEYFRLSEYCIFALIAGLAVFLLIDTADYPLLHITGLNLMLAAALFYFVQGLGVIKFLLMRRGVPVYIIPLTFAGLLFMGFAGIWALMFLSVLIAGLGALDIWADFRNLTKKDTRS
ncbi:MAG: hypothetical protein A2W19_00910 [Spirochaetes bacterium RBG_16_49_21]|nr:MAG: hypothetical protein A2W19_00910 [Spirochaetes bacterium RBG_16_49_21]